MMQSTLWGTGDIEATPVTAPWTHLDHASAFLHQKYWLRGADEAFERIRSGLTWGSPERRPMYDRIVDVPRLTVMLQRRALATANPHTAEAAIASIASESEAIVGASFDHVGINFYRDGQDSVAWHRDKIGRDRGASVIALVSLGGPRMFRIRPCRGHGSLCTSPAGTRHDLLLHSGDLVVMSGACQRDWEHAVPKSATAPPRISIVLRTKRSCEGPLFAT